MSKKNVRLVRSTSTSIIRPLIKKNPLKPGSFCFAQVQAVLTSKTVAEAQRKLAADKKNPSRKRQLETAWLRRMNFIALKSA